MKQNKKVYHKIGKMKNTPVESKYDHMTERLQEYKSHKE